MEELLPRLDLDRLSDTFSEQNRRGTLNIIYMTKFRKDTEVKHIDRYVARALVDLYGYTTEDAKKGFNIGTFPAEVVVESREDLNGNIKRSVILRIEKLDIEYETELDKVLKD